MSTEIEYQEALKYLYSFVDYSLTRVFRYSPDKFDLQRMRDFTAYLGNPQNQYPIIHVAGTKGKGSVSSFCAAALKKAGYKVGLYTSPHLQDYAERIQIDNQPIEHKELVELVDEIKPYLNSGTKLTTFELTTALAFLYFARKGATAVVAEVGLGGRLDATNIVTPVVSVITTLSYDHSEFLGNTLAKIAAEKAGIIKPGIPVVLEPQRDEARNVVNEIAKSRGSKLIQVGKDYLFAPMNRSLDGQTFLVWSPSEQGKMDKYVESGTVKEWEPTRLFIPLLGYHQVENAATAYVALKTAVQSGMKISEEAIREGFASTRWLARFEILRKEPPVVIDSAHNRDSARKLRTALDDYFPGVPVIMVFGASNDKDVEGMFAELMPRVSEVIVTKSYHPRAMEVDKLGKFARKYGKPVKEIDAIEDAMETAITNAGSKKMVLAAGSIFIAAGARQTWIEKGLGKKLD